MGVCPQTWADCASAFAQAGEPARAVELLEEYLAQHASRVTAYACYETAPLRLLAQLLCEAGEVQRAAEVAARARASPHRVPADG
jgi:Tetratricopeptide repeat